MKKISCNQNNRLNIFNNFTYWRNKKIFDSLNYVG